MDEEFQDLEAQRAAEAFADGNLTIDFGAAVSESEVPPQELADQPAMTTTSLRLPVELLERLKAVSEKRGTTMGALLREGAEMVLASLESDAPISRADALRALAGVRALGNNHHAA